MTVDRLPLPDLSAGCGMMLRGFLTARYATDIDLGLRITWLLVAGAYVLTLMIEWPFVAACFRGTRRWLTAKCEGVFFTCCASDRMGSIQYADLLSKQSIRIHSSPNPSLAFPQASRSRGRSRCRFCVEALSPDD